MAKVDYTKNNIDHCLCGKCPVQINSKCAHDMYNNIKDIQSLPKPEQVPGIYCSSGRATCNDLQVVQNCLCPGCLVWADYSLASNHYCARGSAAQTR
ncbi:MAG: DUF2769 domain-containing protein [Bacteroidales bacterium]|jgi:hypothetical protein|nr:DUF2769 domain-containing protein [Bacteroidales bacterium]NLW69319.1 DUF2769 domain-containing protein [Bacteriovoracaceae bacterium]